MNQKIKNNIVIGTLCALVLLIAVGYAAFSSILNINGTSSINSNWNIKITNIEEKNIIGTAKSTLKENGSKNPDFTDLTATFFVDLKSPGDAIEYDITIENKGTLNAILDRINISDSNSNAIQFKTSGLTEGTTLKAGEKTVLTVKVEFLEGIVIDENKLSANLTVTLDYKQANVKQDTDVAFASISN